MTIDKLLDQIYEIPDESKITLQNYISEVTFPKGHILLKADRVETNLYFIKKE